MLKVTRGKKVVALAMAILLFATPISSLLAQEGLGDFAQGKLDGERDAKGNPIWFLAGVGCGIIGVGIAYLVKPSPPAAALIGKSSEYVLGYTDGYQNKSRSKNATYACGGWLVFVIIFVAAGGLETDE